MAGSSRAPRAGAGRGAGAASAPGISASLQYMQAASPADRYLLPLGWLLDEEVYRTWYTPPWWARRTTC